jgi:uncharacterized Zn finger protein (UPF0148 family)
MENIFRIKKTTDASPVVKTQGTLDYIHSSIVSGIKDTKLNTVEIEERCSALETEMEDLNVTSSISDIIKASKAEQDLKELRDKLHSKNPVEEYYLKNADIMLQYYGNTDKPKQTINSCMDENTFVKYLVTNTSSDIGSQTKKQLFEEYATRMKLKGMEVPEMKQVVTEHCENCNIPREELSSEGVLVCPKCGSEEFMMVVSDFPSFRDPPKERNNYAYKKINHLNEILNQFQAKESTIIPDEVMHEVIGEIKKRRIQNIAQMSEKEIRDILKKLNKSKYYEHAAHILSRLNGNPPPTITPEIEEKIRTMFQEIQAPFLLYCPDDRTNFLSYSYILFKFFELLELDEYKAYFPLLKSRDRLIAHDQIWKKICEYLRWEFVQSV